MRGFRKRNQIKISGAGGQRKRKVEETTRRRCGVVSCIMLKRLGFTVLVQLRF